MWGKPAVKHLTENKPQALGDGDEWNREGKKSSKVVLVHSSPVHPPGPSRHLSTPEGNTLLCSALRCGNGKSLQIVLLSLPFQKGEQNHLRDTFWAVQREGSVSRKALACLAQGSWLLVLILPLPPGFVSSGLNGKKQGRNKSCRVPGVRALYNNIPERLRNSGAGGERSEETGHICPYQ